MVWASPSTSSIAVSRGPRRRSRVLCCKGCRKQAGYRIVDGDPSRSEHALLYICMRLHVYIYIIYICIYTLDCNRLQVKRAVPSNRPGQLLEGSVLNSGYGATGSELGSTAWPCAGGCVIQGATPRFPMVPLRLKERGRPRANPKNPIQDGCVTHWTHWVRGSPS